MNSTFPGSSGDGERDDEREGDLGKNKIGIYTIYIYVI